MSSIFFSIDQQTLISIVAGIVVSMLTFWLTYRKTFGAEDERAKTASNELISSVLKRVAVERQIMALDQYEKLRQAKSYRTGLPTDRLIKFADAKAVALMEIIDNNFLDQESKAKIISLLDDDSVSDTVTPSNFSELDKNIKRQKTVTRLAVISSLVGLIFSVLISILDNSFLESVLHKAGRGEIIVLLAIVLAGALLALAARAVLPLILYERKEVHPDDLAHRAKMSKRQ